MEEEVEQTVSMPNVFRTESFISARFKELHALTNLMSLYFSYFTFSVRSVFQYSLILLFVEKTNRVTSIFQRLPKRMRRRAMSHSIKRVPRNLREAHKRQVGFFFNLWDVHLVFYLQNT